MLIYLIKRNLKQYPFSVQLARIYTRYFKAPASRPIVPRKPKSVLKPPIKTEPLKQNLSKSNGKIFYAVWDFEVCPITFDFLNFLVICDIEREKRGCEHLQIIIVPGPFDGFRDAKVHSIDEKKFRLWSIITPSINLLPSNTRVTMASHRDEARKLLQIVPENEIFPPHYTIDKPINRYNWNAIRACYEDGQNLQRFESDMRSKALINNWVKANCAGKKILTFSLRESTYETDRNSNLEAIKSFVKKVDKSKFAIVIIRDLDLASESFSEWSDLGAIDGQIAIWDIRLRQAMYERADLNFFVNNGPFVMALFSKNIAYAVFKMITESVFVTSTKYFENNQWSVGKDFLGANENQRIYWEDESEKGFFRALRDMKLMGDDE